MLISKDILNSMSDKLHNMFDEIEVGNKDRLVLSVRDLLDDLHNMEEQSKEWMRGE